MWRTPPPLGPHHERERRSRVHRHAIGEIESRCLPNSISAACVGACAAATTCQSGHGAVGHETKHVIRVVRNDCGVTGRVDRDAMRSVKHRRRADTCNQVARARTRIVMVAQTRAGVAPTSKPITRRRTPLHDAPSVRPGMPLTEPANVCTSIYNVDITRILLFCNIMRGS